MGEGNPEISVLLIVHNGEATLSMALRSLLLQTYEHWECIVVDDASTDGTADVLEQFPDERFRILRLPSRQGRGGARAVALAHARAGYIASLDADDFYFSTYLERQVRVLATDSGVRAVSSPVMLFDGRLKALGLMRGRWPAGRYLVSQAPLHLRIPFGSTVFRRQGAEDVVYLSDYPRAEDYDFYTRLLRGQKLVVADTPLYAYRWQFRIDDVIAGLQQTERVYRASLSKFPFRARVYIGACRGKVWLYRALSFLGLWEWSARWRYRQVSAEQKSEFEELVRRVSSH